MTQEEIEELFKGFNNLNVIIVGDVMVDSYLWGNVQRISPEAPVPVFEITKRENRLGGAANVALNIQSLGATPILCGVIGQDVKGDIFKELLNKRGQTAEGIVVDQERVTTCKTRVISSSHHLLRIDEEQTKTISEQAQNDLYNRVVELTEKHKINVLIFEDYDKGVLSEALIQRIVEHCNKLNIPTSVDPKKENFHAYKNTTLFKPNFKEFTVGLKEDVKTGDVAKLQEFATDFRAKTGIQKVMVTLSEHGVMLSEEGEQIHTPAEIRNISDVSGAGDTVIATASLALASGLSNNNLVKLANLAGGLVCEEVGVIPINKEKLKAEFISNSK